MYRFPFKVFFRYIVFPNKKQDCCFMLLSTVNVCHWIYFLKCELGYLNGGSWYRYDMIDGNTFLMKDTSRQWEWLMTDLVVLGESTVSLATFPRVWSYCCTPTNRSLPSPVSVLFSVRCYLHHGNVSVESTDSHFGIFPERGNCLLRLAVGEHWRWKLFSPWVNLSISGPISHN